LLNNLLNYFLKIHRNNYPNQAILFTQNSWVVLNEILTAKISTKNVRKEFSPDEGQLNTDKWYLIRAVVAKSELIP